MPMVHGALGQIWVWLYYVEYRPAYEMSVVYPLSFLSQAALPLLKATKEDS